MVFGPAAAGKVLIRAHLAAADGGNGVGGAAAVGVGVVAGPAAGIRTRALTAAGGVVGGAAAVVVYNIIGTSVYIAIAAGPAAECGISGAPQAS